MTKIRRQIFDNSIFTHKNVGPFSYFIHKMSGPGFYNLSISNGNTLVHQTIVELNSQSKNINQHIDIAVLAEKKDKTLLSFNEHVEHLLFYHSKDVVNCRIVMTHVKSQKVEFDSHKPSENDSYAITLLKPGEYDMKNAATQKISKLKFEYEKKPLDIDRVRLTNAFTISKETAAPKSQEMKAANGLVINFDEKNKGFELTRKKDFKNPNTGNFLDDLKKEIKNRRAKRKKPSRKTVKKFRRELSK